MSRPHLNAMTVASLLQLLERGEVSAVDVAEATLQAIEARDEAVNAFISLNREEALAQARAADDARRRGDAGPLAGIPIAIKDILLTKGLRTTAASNILRDFTPPLDATVVSKLRDAGAVFVGKTNCDEFAMGSSNENSAFGPVQNPAAPGRIPGGSSGGSAAAVAADFCAAAIGTDTGGSIRQPASMTGTVGLKPTYGRVSRFGVVAFASSLDQVGPMTRTTWDAAKILDVIAGHDPRDATSANRPVGTYAAAAAAGPEHLKGMKLGVPREYFLADALQPEVHASVQAAIRTLADAGAEIVEVSLPHTEYAVATYYLIATAEASSNLARYDGMRFGHRTKEAAALEDTYARSRGEGFGAEVKRRIMLGTYALSAGYYDAYYLKAQKVRTLIRRDFEQAFASVDALITPTSPMTAWPQGDKIDDPLQMYLADILTIPCNLAGLPGLTLPCGADTHGAPIGLQLLGPWFAEETLCTIGGAFETLAQTVEGQGGAS